MEDPLDVSGIAQTPCKAISKEQAEAFPGSLSNTGVSASTALENGKSCGWIFKGEKYSIGSVTGGVVLPEAKYQGLTSIYSSHQQGAFETFRPVGPIEGYPAVIWGDEPGDGYCRMSVGLRNDTAYRITTGLAFGHPYEDKPCEMAKKLAGYVVANLKAGQ